MTMKTIIGKDHWIEGAERNPLKSGGSMSIRRFLVEHFSGGWADAVHVMKERGVSAHLVVQRDGSFVQCVPFNQVAYHAGESAWRDPKTGILYRGLNSCSIGIEIANCGDLERQLYPSTMGPAYSGKPIPRITAKHKNGGGTKQWETYSPAQIATVTEISKALVARYNLDDVIGHDDISPGRKADPGPAFPLREIRLACGFPVAIPKLRL